MKLRNHIAYVQLSSSPRSLPPCLAVLRGLARASQLTVDVRTIGKAGKMMETTKTTTGRQVKTVPAVIGPCTLMPFALNHRNSDAFE